jgi:hypothetical protein
MNKKDKALIAKFMGLSKIKEGWTTDSTKPITPLNEVVHAEMEDETWYVSDVRFDESWDWIMPVVEKIMGMGYCVNINHVSTLISNNYGSTEIKKYVKIGYNSSWGNITERTNLAIIEFIEWHNENKRESISGESSSS